MTSSLSLAGSKENVTGTYRSVPWYFSLSLLSLGPKQNVCKLMTAIKCVRLGKACHYPSGRKPYGSRASNNSESSPSSISVAASSYEAAPQFPDAFFLDTDLFHPISHSELRSSHSIPSHISCWLGSDVNTIYEHYFNSVDTWLPFVSRKRLKQGIQANDLKEASGLALLLLCMKLASEQPDPHGSSSADSALYKAAKSYLVTVEELSPASLHLFQSLVLIALYELGHGIFPAAYLTVGRAARLGILRGYHDRKNATQLFTTPPSWTYWEEERRTWWAASILERCLNLGPKGFPLAFPEPAQGELLPTTDLEWSRGDIGTTQALFTTGFSPDSEIGSFARVCQVSHILGHVITHRDRRKNSDSRSSILSEALQLNNTLAALENYLSQSSLEIGDEAEMVTTLDVALCICAQLALYHIYACNMPDSQEQRIAEENTMQAACISGIKKIMDTQGAALARRVLAQGMDDLNKSSPLVAQCLYDIATECQWFIREGDAGDSTAETLQLTMDALSLVAQRWEIAGKCLRLLNHSAAT
ncbi:hypothetical protein BGZ63DRAFT_419312 [Mariannaea sp. PMI_226]|nr:hypothetical protein BGZ63DRAFT_419312 [Mariannaea sp. PMI_226]